MSIRLIALMLFGLTILAPANAQQNREGEYLYKVSTIRLAPGEFEAFLNWAEEVKASDYFKESGGVFPLLMRHSQGDQWDLLALTPMDSWLGYYARTPSRKRDKAAEKYAELIKRGQDLIAFEEDHFAYGPPLFFVQQEYDATAFYHVEMFEAAPGKAEELFEQRRMENAYLAATGQTTNMIFRRAAGSDVDVFTIGFHESMKAFAADAPATPEEKEQAAKDAGFKDRADLSFYLRSLISGHHDTLAVKVE